jgi:hypothetical protein
MAKRYKSKMEPNRVYFELWRDDYGALLQPDGEPATARSFWTTNLIKNALDEIIPDKWVIMRKYMNSGEAAYKTGSNTLMFDSLGAAKSYMNGLVDAFPTTEYYVAKLVKCD